MRLDIFLTQKFRLSRNSAKEAILAGYVKIGERVILKPAHVLGAADFEAVRLLQNPREFVSRGGKKLLAALTAFDIRVEGQVCLDVGASAGGFTDCLLRRGAAKVYAIDNGKAQLADALRRDPRVISREQTDIRQLPAAWHEPERPGFACIDVSFISLTKVLAPVMEILADSAELVCLIKPQFELERGQVPRSGIIKSEKLRLRAVERVRTFAGSIGLSAADIIPVPDTGAGRNQEYLAYFKKTQLPTGYKP